MRPEEARGGTDDCEEDDQQEPGGMIKRRGQDRRQEVRSDGNPT
jgi:hypothetical protein